MEKKIFKGVKILDFCWMGVGVIGTKYLADWGADVVHVQSHSRPCPLSVMMPFKGPGPHIDRGWWTAEYNTSKYSLAVDMKKKRTREIIYRLITDWKPDIISESFGRDAMKDWGLDYEHVRELKSDIIYFSTSQQGRSGRLAGFPGHGGTGASMAGFFDLTGWPDRSPGSVYGAYTDFINPRYICVYLITALERKRRTGKGIFFDQSQIETGLHIIAPVLMDYMVNNNIFSRNGNRLPYASPHGVFPCKGTDRWVAIEVYTDEEWQNFCKVTNHAEWIDDIRFSTITARKENEDKLEKLIAEWTKDHTAEEIESRMQKAGVAASVVENIKDIFEDPQIAHRDHIRMMDWHWPGRQENELTAFSGVSFKMSKVKDNQRPPDIYGESNVYVLKEFLGMTNDDISDLYAEGVLTTEDDFLKLLGLK